MKAGFRHIGLVVSDLDRLRKFYECCFGFHIVRECHESGAFIDRLIGIPETRVTTVKMALGVDGIIVLELLCFRKPSIVKRDNTRPNNLGLTHFALTVDDISTAVDLVLENGGSVTSKAQISPDGQVLASYCCDPEGNLIELVEERR